MLAAVLRTGLLLLATVTATAAPAPPAGIAGRSELAPAIALSHRVEHLKHAFRNGQPAQVQAAAQEVELLRRTYGTLDVVPLVEAMAVFAREQGDLGHPEVGLEVIETVDRWAPHSPTLLGSRVILLRQQGLAGYLRSVADVAELTRLRLSHPVHQWLWVIQHIAWVRLMVTLMLWGWALTLALRYRRVLRYLWENPLARTGWHPAVLALVGAFLITLPVLLGLDPSLVAMLWLWLLVPFLQPLEVRATVLILLLQLAHPALGLLEPMAAVHARPSLLTLQQRPQPLTEDELAARGLTPGDQAFLAGWRLLQMQEWAKAEAAFGALNGKHLDRAAVLNNLGVARFQQGNLAGAKKAFDSANVIAPLGVEILLNQSVVAYREIDSTLGSAKQEEARKAGPELLQQLLAANQARTEQRTFAMPMADTPARVAVLADSYRDSTLPSHDGVKPAALLFSLLLPLAALGGFFWRLRMSINQTHPSQCTRCGDPFHTTDSPDVFVCSKCHHLFVLKDGLHAESRKRKVDEVASYQTGQRWIHKTLTVLLPGMDRLFMGDTRNGLVEFVFLCFSLAVVLGTGRSVRYPGEILMDPASIWLPLGLGLLAVLFLRSWLKLLPRRS
jgi:tetratricopeptide (TPR) repeat protein